MIVPNPPPSAVLRLEAIGWRHRGDELRCYRLEVAHGMGPPFTPGQLEFLSPAGRSAAERVSRLWDDALRTENILALETLLADAERILELDTGGG